VHDHHQRHGACGGSAVAVSRSAPPAIAQDPVAARQAELEALAGSEETAPESAHASGRARTPRRFRTRVPRGARRSLPRSAGARDAARAGYAARVGDAM
jgi:hypothetical protein